LYAVILPIALLEGASLEEAAPDGAAVNKLCRLSFASVLEIVYIFRF